MAKPGDRVKIETKEKVIEGILVPSPETEEDVVFVKLDNGYNVGVDKKNVKSISVVEAYKEGKKIIQKSTQKRGLPKITILHTGGTIASRVDYRTGAVVSKFSPAELLEMFPELKEIANFDSSLISNMWSDDLRFGHFEKIAKAVENEVKKGVDGIIVGMGTDNLAVASAALAFILEGLPVPVILVGAQRSSDRGSSDAAVNLASAASFIVRTDFSGVALCMHESENDDTCLILPPCKTYKLHSSRRDAFRPVNDYPIARVNYEKKLVEFIKKDYLKKDKSRKLIVRPKMEDKVGILKIHIHMFPEQFDFYKGYRGLVIDGTGLGHTPGHVPDEIAKENEGIFPAIKRLTDSGCVVVMTTQSLYGRINMNVYSKGRDLQQLGVIPGEDMLPDTAFVKLAWLLGNYPREEAKELIGKNLRGEINERSREETFLI